MQVSWIDPEEVAALAESLRPSSRVPAPPPVEMPKPELVEPLVKDGPAAPAEPAAGEGQASPDMDAFRDRLQKIRERAIQAGLMTARPEPVAAVEPAPVEPVKTEGPVSEPEPESAPDAEAEPEPAPTASEPDFQPPPAPAWEEVTAEAPAPEPEPQAEYAPVPEPEPAPVWTPAPPLAEAYAAPAYFPVREPVAVAPEPGLQLPADASVKDRLEAFASWTAQRGTHGELLIVDEYGDLLWGPPKKSGLVLSTMMAWNAAIRASAQAASGVAQIRQQLLPAGETLTLIPCQSRLGLLQIALVTAQAPQEEDSAAMRQTLLQLMDLGR